MRIALLAALGCTLAGAATAQTASTPTTVAGVDVIDSTPAPGSSIARDKIAGETAVLTARDIDRGGIPNLTGAILATLPAATINDVEGNPFQPDILFRGFTASPVAGTPQGLAVYVNGARFNDAFGDTVNWDLIPASAIDAVAIEASNPVFGLNALGGSVNVRLKTGLSEAAREATLYGGAYGRVGGGLELSRRVGAFGLYVAGDVIHDDGFRRTGSSDVRRVFADLGWRGEAAEFHLALSGADNLLGNPGAAPVQALAADVANIFTAPNTVQNQYFAATLNGDYRPALGVALHASAYVQTLTQRVPNGNTVEAAPCDDGSGLLCNADGTVVTGPGGRPVADFLNGGPYSGLDVTKLVTHAYGVAAQATHTARLLGKANRLVAGVSYDGSDSVFSASQAIGGFDPYTRDYVGPGVVQDQPSEGINPVRVLSVTRFWGAYLSDLLTVKPGVDLTVAGRFNDAQVALEDQRGGPVNGAHDFSRFNPSAGLAVRLGAGIQAYGGYAETNRAPTPLELSCASAANPCSLLNVFVGDPDLEQVVARTVEGGLRGKAGRFAGGSLSWEVGYYRAANTHDIIYEATVYNPNLAFYTNAGKTLRQGAEASLRFEGRRVRASLGYAYTDATFRSRLLLNSGSNPAADANGNIAVQPGDRIPGIPRHRADLTLDYQLTERWSAGASVAAQSPAYRFGDEANLTKPVAGYAVVDLNTAWRLTRRVTLFALINNALDTRYDTYGSFGPVRDVPWPNVPGGVTDPRTASPGTPIAGYGGARVEF